MLARLLAYAGEKYPQTLPIQEQSRTTIKRFRPVCAGFSQEKQAVTFRTFAGPEAAR